MAVDVVKSLERAKRYLEKNKVEDAIEAYQQVLEAAPGHQEAMQALGDLYSRLDKPERAAMYYGLLFDRLTDPREEHKATALYTRFLKTVVQPPERVARYAQLLQKQDKLEEAIEQYAAAAELFIARRNEPEALTCWVRTAELDPDNAARHVALGEFGERLGKPAIAARGFLRAGQLAEAAGELDRALELFSRAHRLLPVDRPVALCYAQAQLKRGDAAAAVKLLEPISGSHTDTRFLEVFGEALMRMGELDRARPNLEEVAREKADGLAALFELADRYVKAKQDNKAVEILTRLKKRMLAAHQENDFAVQLDRLANANPSSVPLLEFWVALYNELNREAKYFDALVQLFDARLDSGDVKGACEALDRLVDIDPYDFRNQQRMERLKGRADAAYLSGVTSRLVTIATQGQQAATNNRTLSEESVAVRSSDGSTKQALEDLLVQTEIFLQYSLQAKAVERLQKVAELFPGEEEQNERLRNLYQLAHWAPPGSKRPEPAASTAPSAVARTGAYSPETLRDLAKISEVNQNVFRQPTPRAMLSATVNEVGKYLRASRSLAVIGTPGQPPQMAAEFCAPGVEASTGSQILRLLAQIERATPDDLGGLSLHASAAPSLAEMGLVTALGVQLTDKETQAQAGMLVVGHSTDRKWKQNETYFLQAIGDQMLFSVNHTKLRSLVRSLAVADEKTGLLARSSYPDCLLGETIRSKTQGTPLSVALLQIDRGPELIHQHGEALVERHMEQLARALQSVVRQNDLAVKYNAWALAFILPDTNLAAARVVIEKLRKAAVGTRQPWDGGPPTVSAGVVEAANRPEYENEDIATDLLNRADLSLEEARRKGGDTVATIDVPRA